MPTTFAAAGPSTQSQRFGDMLRAWRETRRLSQLELALKADVSQRHISFLESGRAQPSREMVQQIAEAWDVTQANVSQIEHTPDVYLSTLRNYVAALGGCLEINAVFPDQTVRLLSGVMERGGATSLDEPAAAGGTEPLTG